MNVLNNVQRLRLKYAATINDDVLGEETESDYELQYVDIGNVDSSGTIDEIVTYRFADAPSRARRRVRDGDVVVSCVRTYLQAIAPIQTPPKNLIVSTGFAVVRPRGDVFDAGYCKYALREPASLAEVEMPSVGVSYPAINASDLADIAVYLPPVHRQCSIADFLDRETTLLDALMAAKERLLEILVEKRRALITRALTRGLDPDVPLRDSGNLSLGEIPKHWKATRLKFFTEVRGGLTLGKNYSAAELVEFPYLRVANVQDGHVDLSDVATVMIPQSEADSCLLAVGDVLMNEGGDADKLRRGCIWYGKITPCLHQNHVFTVRPRHVRFDWLNAWIFTNVPKVFFNPEQNNRRI